MQVAVGALTLALTGMGIIAIMFTNKVYVILRKKDECKMKKKEECKMK